jgi:hypothetical protein
LRRPLPPAWSDVTMPSPNRGVVRAVRGRGHGRRCAGAGAGL